MRLDLSAISPRHRGKMDADMRLYAAACFTELAFFAFLVC